MAANTKPTLVIIHGGWHTPASYKALTESLQSEGYEVHCPLLPSTEDVRPPTADLYSDTYYVRGYVECLLQEGRTVVAVMHSYGGHVGSNALYDLGVDKRAVKGLKGGISHLIYLSGYAVPEGEPTLKTVEDEGDQDFMDIAFPQTDKDKGDEKTRFPADPYGYVVGAAPEGADVEAYVKTWVKWNGECMYQPSTHAAWREMPVSYIFTTKDSTVPIGYQQGFVEKMKQNGRKMEHTIEIASGHCANFTATQEVVDAIVKITSSSGKTATDKGEE
ncbi:alpha/beta-hydrolase [Xylariaceae sp. FL0594]|nr:alpha/beta-hydrolase [Xylariaceae sp. FL0594]